MARDKAKRQKKLLKKRQKDKLRKKQAASASTAFLSAAKKIRSARQYPIHECLINPSWKEKGLATIVVSRRQPDGDILFGVYLVDILCLGLKNTFCNADFSPSRYRTDVVGGASGAEPLVPCSRELAHQIIYGAIRFARQFGFEPQKDFQLSQYVLDEAESVAPNPDLEFGRKGQPLFIAGPEDDVPRILRQLEATAGRGSFRYLYGTESPIPYLPDGPGQTARTVE